LQKELLKKRLPHKKAISFSLEAFLFFCLQIELLMLFWFVAETEYLSLSFEFDFLPWITTLNFAMPILVHR
jgi:hypothetical protein